MHFESAVLRLRPPMMVATSSSGRQRSHAGEPATAKRSLASILRDHGPIPVTDAIDIALDVCDELANAHANGIVHGDLGMHRVRTHWPRVPGQRVDIFSLGENDSAAFTFRASAVAGLVAPEQRENRPVDRRADVWAVGAMLHWMIAGAAPTGDPVEQMLAKAPRTVAVAIDACLAVDPSKRPQSVDELAEVIASFASSPPDRFEQLAQRRSRVEKAKRVRSDLGDVESVLGRLDDAALQRELVAASTPPVGAAALDRLMFAVEQSTGGTSSVIFEKSVADLIIDDQQDIETVLAQPRYVPGMAAEDALSPVTSPLSIAPVILSSELVAPPKDAPAPEASALAEIATAAPRAPRRWAVALGIAGAALAVSVGVGIGMNLVERALARQEAVATAPASLASPAVKTEMELPRPATASRPTLREATARAENPIVVTPASLPDARPATAVTPASLPDAKPAPAPVVRVARPKESAPSTNAAESATAESPAEAPSTSLSDALR